MPLEEYKGARIISITGFKDALELGKYLSQSAFCPQSYMTKSPDGKLVPHIHNIVAAIMYGAEIGLPPITSLELIAIIEGRPTLYGDGMMTLVAKSGLLDYYTVDYEGNFGEDDYKAVVKFRRKDQSKDFIYSYSVAQAKRAGLWMKKSRYGNDTPWSLYPDRMLLNRCRTFALREVFPDILHGLMSTEEMQEVVEMKEANVINETNVSVENNILPNLVDEETVTEEKDILENNLSL